MNRLLNTENEIKNSQSSKFSFSLNDIQKLDGRSQKNRKISYWTLDDDTKLGELAKLTKYN